MPRLLRCHEAVGARPPQNTVNQNVIFRVDKTNWSAAAASRCSGGVTAAGSPPPPCSHHSHHSHRFFTTVFNSAAADGVELLE